jgi:hypothetical protein
VVVAKTVIVPVILGPVTVLVEAPTVDVVIWVLVAVTVDVVIAGIKDQRV